jgi:hypothetical protein
VVLELEEGFGRSSEHELVPSIHTVHELGQVVVRAAERLDERSRRDSVCYAWKRPDPAAPSALRLPRRPVRLALHVVMTSCTPSVDLLLLLRTSGRQQAVVDVAQRPLTRIPVVRLCGRPSACRRTHSAYTVSSSATSLCTVRSATTSRSRYSVAIADFPAAQVDVAVSYAECLSLQPL